MCLIWIQIQLFPPTSVTLPDVDHMSPKNSFLLNSACLSRWILSWLWVVWRAGLTSPWHLLRPSTTLCPWHDSPFWSYREKAWLISSDPWVNYKSTLNLPNLSTLPFPWPREWLAFTLAVIFYFRLSLLNYKAVFQLRLMLCKLKWTTVVIVLQAKGWNCTLKVNQELS